MTMLCHVSNQMFVHLMACKHLLHNRAHELLLSQWLWWPTDATEMSCFKT